MDDESKQKLELTDEEQVGLRQAAAGGPPFSQRAQALLALADGADLAEAGIASGLTVNQVRYWLGRFGTRSLGIFPDELLTIHPPGEETETEPTLLPAPEKAPMLAAPDIAGELSAFIPNATAAAATVAAGAAGGIAVAKAKKKRGKKSKQSAKKKAAAKKGKKDKKGKQVKKGKRSKKDKKARKDKKGEKSKKSKKGKKKK